MSESAQIRNLRKLLGSQTLEHERRKGKRLRETEMRREVAAEPVSNRDEVAEVPFHRKSPSTQDRQGYKATQITQDKVVEDDDKSRKIGSNGLKGFTAPWSDSESSDLSEPNFRNGQESDAGDEFVPILAASRFPYKFFSGNKELMESIAGASFNNGKFWERKWTIFCLACPEEVSTRLVFFTPRAEVAELLVEAGRRLNTTIRFPRSQQDPGFCVSFNENEPRPCYIGVSRSREDFDEMEDKVPTHVRDAAFDLSRRADDKSWRSFRGKVEAAVKSARSKRNKSTNKTKIDRVAQKRSWYVQLQHAQQYLGLREGGYDLFQVDGNSQSRLYSTFSSLRRDALSSMDVLPPTDSRTAPAFVPFRDIVFVSIDVEAHERHASMITEIGVSSLDTRDIKHVAPGPAAKDWRSFIKHRHFRIEEYKHHKNHEFIHGCPDRFEKDFGESEFIRKDDIPKAMALCCKSPFYHRVSQFLDSSLETWEQSHPTEPEPRKMVLVGHDISSDIAYLKSTGFDILSLSCLIETLDTSLMHRALVHETQATSLGGVLHQFDIQAWNLHNAGNDAGYTLQALLAIAVEHLSNPRFREMHEELAQTREAAIKAATEHHNDDFQEWLGAVNHADGPNQR